MTPTPRPRRNKPSRAALLREADRAALLAAAGAARDDGVELPCSSDPALWTSDDPHDQDAAAARCLAGAGCPLLALCAGFVRKHPHEYGTYGGLTEQDRRLRRPGARQLRRARPPQTTREALTINREARP